FGSTNLTGLPGLSGGGGGDPALDNFMAKYDSSGNVLWVMPLGRSHYGAGVASAVDSNDKINVAGTFNSTVTFGNTTLTNTGTASMFVAKLASATRPALGISRTGDGISLSWPAWA